ncbi:tetratricopeptide repeat protein [Ruminobacter amylophilus]|uniref:tetratricopeptide repeat protein n=1 Tax=Ruminobacter amylophilus TaxID=867 RepID=UPI0038691EBC
MKNKLLYLSVVIFLFLSSIASADDAAECLKLEKESNYTEAFQPCQNACNQKNGWACSTLAYQYYTGQGTVQSYVHAKINFEKACNLNNGYGCFMVGALYNKGEGVIKSYKEAGRFFKKGCNLREANGCYELGYLYENPESNDHDYVNAGKYYKKACNLGQQKGCNAYKSINRDDSKDSTGADSNKASYCVFCIRSYNMNFSI